MSFKLSLIVPIYNAELFILDTLNRLVEWKQNVDYNVEIILVNDGSTDNTQIIIEDFIKKANSLELISYASNKGKGYAIKKGMLFSKGDFKIFTDADLPYGLSIFKKILHHLDFQNYDICIGNRNSIYSQYHVKMSMLRKISSKLFTLVVSRYIFSKVIDTQCGVKGFTASAANKVFSEIKIKGFAFDVETVYLSYKYDFNVKKIPVKFQGNNISTINFFKTSVRMFLDVLYLPIRFNYLKKQ